MIKVNLNKQKEIGIEDLSITDHIGFIDSKGYKGYFAYVGNKNYVSAICCEVSSITCNISYGLSENNRHARIPSIFSYMSIGGLQPVEMYKFETRKELYKWLSE